MEDLKEGINSIVEIISLTRCQRAVLENQEKKYVPSKSVKITFAGQIRPNKVSIFNAIHKVYIYTSPVKRCTNCLRFNHSAKECKDSPNCNHCGNSRENHPDPTNCPLIESPPKCINCKGDHVSLSSSCPILAHLKDIHNYAAINNISYSEAKDAIKSLNQTPIAPSTYNLADFPHIQSPTLPIQNPSTHLGDQTRYFQTTNRSFTAALRHQKPQKLTAQTNSDQYRNNQQFHQERNIPHQHL
ncbi:uncharacterized protein LOC141534090 [Cotesia typhae]|uniref:uncharacterized protein LOC141534090 n=1 Tax=Cotesia typhae TaxID=2053667 RepID=UPI003D68DE51